MASTLYFNSTPAAFELLEDWRQACEAKSYLPTDHVTLVHAVQRQQRLGNLTTAMLPSTYAAMSPLPNAIIEFGASERVPHKFQWERPEVTVAMTTCRRFDLFARTVTSFVAHVKDRDFIKRWLVMDDGSTNQDLERMRDLMRRQLQGNVTVQRNPGPKGHRHSVAALIEAITTPWTLWLEDDWEFIWPGHPIGEGLDIMTHDPKVAMYGFRHWRCGRVAYAKSGVPFIPHAYTRQSVTAGSDRHWPGLSLNPGLFRTEALRGLLPLADHEFEHRAGLKLISLGHTITHAAVQYVKHIGEGRSAYDLNGDTSRGQAKAAPAGKVCVVSSEARALARKIHVHHVTNYFINGGLERYLINLALATPEWTHTIEVNRQAHEHQVAKLPSNAKLLPTHGDVPKQTGLLALHNQTNYPVPVDTPTIRVWHGSPLATGYFNGPGLACSVNSHVTAELLKWKKVPDVPVLYPGLPLPPSRPRHLSSPIRIGMVASPRLEKLSFHLIPVLEALHRKGLQFEFRVLGFGGMAPVAQAFAHAKFPYQLLPATYDDDAKYRFLYELDLGYFCGRCEEGFGFALAEALATGLPCVAENRGGLRDQITHGENGLLVHGNCAVDALWYLAQDNEQRAKLGVAARKRAESAYSLDSFADRWVVAYTLAKTHGVLHSREPRQMVGA